MNNNLLETLPYNRNFKREHFSCGKTALDNYILRNVTNDVKSGTCTCFVILNEQNEVVGYYTLSTESISIEDAPEEYIKSIKYEYVPVILLGRLAVDASMKGRGYGKFLLIDALKKCVKVVTEHIGAVAVVVDPIDNTATSFYSNFGFTLLPDSGRMFMSIKKIKQAFSMS